MVSLEADNGKPLMVMKRVGFHGNDLDAVERLNALSRRICAETPDPAVAAQWLEETSAARRAYPIPSTTSAISSPQRASAPCSAARCATVCGRA